MNDTVSVINLLVIQEGADDETTGSTKRAHTVRVFVEDKPGAFWEVVNEFGVRYYRDLFIKATNCCTLGVILTV